MTLPELKKKLESLDLPIAYRQWAVGQEPELPYLIYYADEDIGFFADDEVYSERYAVTIEVYSQQKDLALESQVKELLNTNNLPYTNYESFLDTENMYMKAYEINI